MLRSDIKPAPIEIAKTKASQTGGYAAEEVLHRSRSLPPGDGFGPKSIFERDPGECSTASAGRRFFRSRAVSLENRPWNRLKMRLACRCGDPRAKYQAGY